MRSDGGRVEVKRGDGKQWKRLKLKTRRYLDSGENMEMQEDEDGMW